MHQTGFNCIDWGSSVAEGSPSHALGLALGPKRVAFMCPACASGYPSLEGAFESLRRRILLRARRAMRTLPTA